MRGSGTVRRFTAWVEPAVAFSELVDDGVDAALLESSDGSGLSVLAVGTRIDTAVPHVALNAFAGNSPRFVGWLGYEGEGRWIEVERSLVFDHTELTVESRGDGDWHAAVGELMQGQAGQSVPAPVEIGEAVNVRWRHDDDAYLAMITACFEAIRRGDAYQLCLTNTATVEDPVDPWTAYLRLRSSSPTHHAGFVRIGGTTLVSASPERFVEVGADAVVSSSPIKGTRRRDPDPRRDDELADELVHDEKERAENLMIVDLVRNDLSRISEVGTVRVSKLLEVERYAQVHQLVSTVEARLRTGTDAADAVTALFPAGSMTGAPKASAMSLLAGLEHGPRGIYSGCFGVIRENGSADLAMVIRSIVFDGGIAMVGAGGGITALSRPVAELDEVRLNAAPLLAALTPPAPLAVPRAEYA